MLVIANRILKTSLLLCALAPTARAETRALLVGVSEYPSLPERYQLFGPRNDVIRLRDVLERRGVAREHIMVLGDSGVDRAQGLPTRANIVQALDTLARQAGEGDIVVLYFAGHGSQQPADISTDIGRLEPDGLHEIFLPRDIGQWQPTNQGVVENAIADHEMRQYVDQMLAKGAFVWAIFDTCHAGSMVRSGTDDGRRHRHVPADELGIPATLMDAARASQAPTTRGGATTGRPRAEGALDADVERGQAVYFYAVRNDESAPEERLPLGDPNRRAHGLFSFTLARALEVEHPLTYQQVGQYILSRYRGARDLNTSVTPVFSGTALDHVVLGQRSVRPRLWPINKDGELTIPVGSLSGVSSNSLFALIPSALASDGQIVGYLRPETITLDRSVLAPLAFGGKDSPNTDSLPAEAHVRLMDTPPEFDLRVKIDASDCRAPCRWNDTLERLRREPVAGADVRWVDEAPDVTLAVRADRIELLSRWQQQMPTGDALVLARATRNEPIDAPSHKNALAAALHSVARYGNLLRLSGQLAEDAHLNGLSVDIGYLRRPSPAVPHNKDEALENCHAALNAHRSGELPLKAIDTMQPTSLRNGDVIVMTLRNTSERLLDLTVLHANARFGIDALFPNEGEVNQLAPGDRRFIDDICLSEFDSDRSGMLDMVRLIVISTPALRQSEPANFSFLSQSPLEVRTRSAGSGNNPYANLFMDAGFGGTTRSQSAARSSRGTGMKVVTIRLDQGERP